MCLLFALHRSLDPNHLVTTGEEGFKADPNAQEPNSWINNGYQGGDFVCNINLPSIDFGTLHLYADQWGFTPSTYTWLGDNFIKDRASIAATAGKPIMLEEYGMGVKASGNFLPTRNELLKYYVAEANKNNYGSSMVWAVSHYSTDTGNTGFLFGSNDGQGYVFGYDGDGSNSTLTQYAYMKAKTAVSTGYEAACAALTLSCIAMVVSHT
jgi:endo-1,4-beta-mannosidase